MKKLFSSLLLIFVFLVVAQTASSQDFPYHLYDVRTLSELVKMNTDLKTPEDKDAKTAIISAKPFYSAVRVKYTGESRKISKERLSLFEVWQRTLKIDPKVLTLLDNEYLFKQCDTEIWIPVQKPVAAYFPKELVKGDNITLYLMAVGGVKIKDNLDSVFLVNEFLKYSE